MDTTIKGFFTSVKNKINDINLISKLLGKLVTNFNIEKYKTLYKVFQIYQKGENIPEELMEKTELIEDIKKILILIINNTEDTLNKKIFTELTKFVDTQLDLDPKTQLETIENGLLYKQLLLSFLSTIDEELKDKCLHEFLTEEKTKDEKPLSENEKKVVKNVFSFIDKIIELLKTMFKKDLETFSILIVIQKFIQKTKSDDNINIHIFLIAFLRFYEKNNNGNVAISKNSDNSSTRAENYLEEEKGVKPPRNKSKSITGTIRRFISTRKTGELNAENLTKHHNKTVRNSNLKKI